MRRAPLFVIYTTPRWLLGHLQPQASLTQQRLDIGILWRHEVLITANTYEEEPYPQCHTQGTLVSAHSAHERANQ